ncbi:MAG: HesA/MoeB/ThiF family protein [Gemmatimonadaceae bacterium]
MIAIHEIVLVPYVDCTRTASSVTWSTESLSGILKKAIPRNMAVLKVHSHPIECAWFSPTDDVSDRQLFDAVATYVDTPLPHASAVMLPDGRMFARLVTVNGTFEPIDCVSVVGHDWRVWHAADVAAHSTPSCATLDEEAVASTPAFAERTKQAFGTGTVEILSRLSIAVIGASGTGSPTVEMLARLGVGELVIVDPDVLKDKNRNRILHSTAQDVRLRRKKVEVLSRAVSKMGLGTCVEPIAASLWEAHVVARISQCDAVVGCMDSVDGRDLLNRLATYYCIPYIDVGVRIDADGVGGISQISGSVHYLFPGGSSLVSRGVFTADDVRAAVLYRTEPHTYRLQRATNYIRGVEEERPAVISVNMLYASLAVNELLARLHCFRDDANSTFARTQLSLTQWRIALSSDGLICSRLRSKVGRGDLIPLLDTPELDILRVEGP